jgi:hypothetical protein
MAAKDNSLTGGETLEKVLSRLDALHTRMDAMEVGEGSKNPIKKDARKDEEEDEDKKKDARDDGEEEEEEEEKKDARKDQVPPQMPPPRAGTGATPPPIAADKKRKDARGKSDDDDDDDDARKDAKKDGDLELLHEGKNLVQKGDKRKDARRGDDDDDDDDRKDAKADSLDELRRMVREQSDVIKRLEGRMRPISDEEHYQFAEAQAKADAVFQGFGQRAPRPLEGESLLRYRKRLATHFKKYSDDWKDVKFSELSEAAFGVAERKVYADAIMAAANPIDLGPGELRPVKSVSSSGHHVTTFLGKESFVKGLGRENRRILGFGPTGGRPAYTN